MERYTAEQLVANYERFLELVRTHFDGERLERLEYMYSEDQLGGRLMFCPASGKTFFHNAYVGGYMDHIFNITRAAKALKILYEKMGATADFTDEELMFAAIHHDLGKLGDAEFEHFIPEDSEWHMKNQGSRFKMNPEIQFMKVPDRALYVLNHYGVVMTQKEWLGIKLSDGAYDKTNHSYLISYNKDYKLETKLPYIVHWADHMSTVVESYFNEE